MDFNGPHPIPLGSNDLIAFKARIKVLDDGCWLWTGAKRKSRSKTYGSFSRPLGDGTFVITAHRAAYIWSHGYIPAGTVVDHICSNKLCVNPAHLEAVTNAENIRRGHQRRGRKTHCAKGHLYDGERQRKRGLSITLESYCRTCNRERVRAWARRNGRADASTHLD